jgi:hypothetical protein
MSRLIDRLLRLRASIQKRFIIHSQGKRSSLRQKRAASDWPGSKKAAPSQGPQRMCGKRRLELCTRPWRDLGKPAGCCLLADDGRNLHPYFQATTGRHRGATSALKFFTWAVPMPAKVVSEIEEMWRKSIIVEFLGHLVAFGVR